MNIEYLDFHLWGALLVVSLGVLFGVAECRVNGACPLRRLFWMVTAAAVFFLPLAALWGILADRTQGAAILMIGVLWVAYLVSRATGAYLYERFIDGVPRPGGLP